MIYGLTGRRLPIHPRPLPDELLTHWFFRVADANGLKVRTLADIAFGPQSSFWGRDQDRQALPEVIARLSELTGLSDEDIKALTLAGHPATNFGDERRFGISRWVLPFGAFRKKDRTFGVQFCPLCLFEDEQPYFRRQWRLAFATMCDRHGIMLHDRCPDCGAPVAWLRNDMGRGHGFASSQSTICWRCRFDLRRGCAVGPPAIDGQSIMALMSLVTFHDLGWWFVGDKGLPYAHLHFDVLRHLVGWLPSERGRPLLARIASTVGWPDQYPDVLAFECRPIEDRHRLLATAVWLLQEWPDRFVDLARELGLTQAYVLLGHRHPFWFEAEIRNALGAGFHQPTAAEAASAAAYLERHGQVVTAMSVGRLIGTKDADAALTYATRRKLPSDEEFERAIANLDKEIAKCPEDSYRRPILCRDRAMFLVAWLSGLPGDKVRRLTVAQGIALRLDQSIAEAKRRRIAGVVLSYLRDVRPKLMAGKEGEWLLPGRGGERPMTSNAWRHRWEWFRHGQ